MLRSSLLITLLAFSATASAEGFDYNWLSFGYGNTEFDEVDLDGDGFGIDGSFAINKNVHLFAEYNAASLDFDVDATTWAAGLGYNTPLSPTFDFVARLSYEYIEIDIPGIGSDDENGLGLGVGLRFSATDALELNGGVDYVDYGDAGDDTAFVLGGLYNFTQAFALGLRGSFGDDVTTYTISGRFYFGQ